MTSTRIDPTVVLDTNLLASALMNPSGSPNSVLRAWQNDEFNVATSPALVAEAADVLTRPTVQRYFALAPHEVLRILDGLAHASTDPVATASLPIHCRDPKDDKVLACALGSGADYIVTGDRDLLDLDGEPALEGLHIVTPEEFLLILSGRSR